MDVTTSPANYLIFLIPINAVSHGFEQIWKYIMKRKLFLPIYSFKGHLVDSNALDKFSKNFM